MLFSFLMGFGMGYAIYTAGLIMWLRRSWTIYCEEIDAPWDLAIQLGEPDRIAYWKNQAKIYPLLRARFMLNPFEWKKNWNWKPAPFCRFTEFRKIKNLFQDSQRASSESKGRLN